MTQYEYINSSYKGIQGITSYVNDQSGGIMAPLMLFILWFIIMISQLGYGFMRALLVSSLISSVISVLMTTLGLLSPTYMYISFVLLGLSVILVRLNHNA